MERARPVSGDPPAARTVHGALLAVLALGPLPVQEAGALAGRPAPVERTLALPGGGTLRFVEVAPEPAADGAVWPVLLCLAPGDGGAESVAAARGHLGGLAREAGYLAIYPISPAATDGSAAAGGSGGSGGFGGTTADAVVALARHVGREAGRDAGRIVLAGLSAGGRSAFEVAARAPEVFAAIVAAPGTAADELDLSGLDGKPVWMRVGSADSEAWRSGVERTEQRLREAGALVDHAVIEDQGHVLDLADQGLPEWLARTLAPGPRRLQFPAPDGLAIGAELHGGRDRSRPLIVLCHQARSSRGEYARIAPRLVAAGYACLVLDQRSGGAMNGVENETARRAAAQGKATGYLDARPDIEAALDWVREAGFDGPLALWGSSYSASLALAVGAGREDLDALLCFSPGEYFGDELSVRDAAAAVECPVLVVAPEDERGQAAPLAEAVGVPKTLFVADGLVHGSSTLVRGTRSEEAWEQVLGFLARHLAPAAGD